MTITHTEEGMVVRFALMLVVLFSSVPMNAQHGGGAPAVRSAPREAAQFNFLVGQWELVVQPAAQGLAARIHGMPKLIGTWKAWRGLDGWGIEDELRITDDAGNPRSLSHAVRFYDATSRRWKASTLDVYRGIFTQSTAEWRDNTMIVTSQGVDADGKRYVARSRYRNITPRSFRMEQERSLDEGRTWKENLKIEAKRVAASAPR